MKTYKLPPKLRTNPGMGKAKKRRKKKQRYATGGSVSRGQYASQPKKVKFKGVF